MTVYSDVKLLHPKFRGVAINLAKSLEAGYKSGETQTLFKIFETFRDPVRQLDALSKGTTKAGIFQSAHALGLACDFVGNLSNDEAIALGEKIGERVLPGWCWHSSLDWDYLTKKAKRFGLITISWDRPHVQHPEAADVLKRLSNVAYMT